MTGGRKKEMTCTLCGGSDILPGRWRPEDYEYGLKATQTLSLCRGCGTYFMEPMPSPAEVASFYPADYTAHAESQSVLMRMIFEGYDRNEAKRMLRFAPEGGALLDVGCGDGAFLRAFQAQTDRFAISGLEFSAAGASKAKSRGFSVATGSLEEAPLEPAAYDVIRLNHVLEHFIEPRRALRNAFSALKPGGLLIGETPNTDALDSRILGKYWGEVHYPRHLWLLSRRALRDLATSVGFEVEAIDNCRRTAGWTCGIQNWLVSALGLRPPPNGRFWWYPALIVIFLPVTFVQALVSSTAVVEFRFRKPASS